MWQGRARPSRVNHSRPWGVQGGGYGGFSPPFIRPAQRSFAVFAALCCDPPPGIRIDLRQRLGIIAGGEGFRPLHREVDQLQGDGHFRQRMVAPTAEHSIRADFPAPGLPCSGQSRRFALHIRDDPAPTSGDVRSTKSGKYYFLPCVFFPSVFMANASRASLMIRGRPRKRIALRRVKPYSQGFCGHLKPIPRAALYPLVVITAG